MTSSIKLEVHYLSLRAAAIGYTNTIWLLGRTSPHPKRRRFSRFRTVHAGDQPTDHAVTVTIARILRRALRCSLAMLATTIVDSLRLPARFVDVAFVAVSGRYPIPDHYSLTLEISRNRTTAAWTDFCGPTSTSAERRHDVAENSNDRRCLRRTLNDACLHLVRPCRST